MNALGLVSLKPLQDDDIKHELRCLEKMVRGKVQADQSQFYADLVDWLAQDAPLHDFRSAYQLLSRLGGRACHRGGLGRPLPLLKDPDGKPITSFLQQQLLKEACL